MKRIHFDNMKSWIWILILSLVFIFNGIFELFENSKLNKRITAVGFFLQVLYYIKMFCYKNYVQWNKKGANIQVNSFWGKSFEFRPNKEN